MFRLHKKEAPFGTRDAPIFEPCYAEEAVVVDGLCEVKHPESRDYLLKMGYSEAVLTEGEGGDAVPAQGEDSDVPAKAARAKAKKRR